MEQNENLFCELKTLSGISYEAKKIYFELMTHVDMLRGNDLLMVYRDEDKSQIIYDLRKLEEQGFLVDKNNKCVKGCDGDRKRVIFLRALSDCQNLKGYIFRRVIFK